TISVRSRRPPSSGSEGAAPGDSHSVPVGVDLRGAFGRESPQVYTGVVLVDRRETVLGRRGELGVASIAADRSGVARAHQAPVPRAFVVCVIQHRTPTP